MNRPASTRHVTDNATCATRRARPKRPNDPTTRRPARTPSSTGIATDRHAETRPIARPITRVSSAVAAMTRASGVTAGNFLVSSPPMSVDLTTRTIPHASGIAPANAMADSRIPSSSSCQNTRRGLPPSARRIATWSRRVSERASMRPARLAHATARSMPIMPRSIPSVAPNRVRRWEKPYASGVISTCWRSRASRSGSGNVVGSVAAWIDGHSAVSSARAAGMDTPGARRPTTLLDRAGREGLSPLPRDSVKGMMRSAVQSVSTPKLSGAIPITVAGTASTLIV